MGLYLKLTRFAEQEGVRDKRRGLSSIYPGLGMRQHLVTSQWANDVTINGRN